MARLITAAAAAVAVVASASTPSVDDGHASVSLHGRWSPSDDYHGYGEKSSNKWWGHRNGHGGEGRGDDDGEEYFGGRHERGHDYRDDVDRYSGHDEGHHQHGYEGRGGWDGESHGEGKHGYGRFTNDDGDDEQRKRSHYGNDDGQRDHGDDHHGLSQGHHHGGDDREWEHHYRGDTDGDANRHRQGDGERHEGGGDDHPWGRDGRDGRDGGAETRWREHETERRDHGHDKVESKKVHVKGSHGDAREGDNEHQHDGDHDHVRERHGRDDNGETGRREDETERRGHGHGDVDSKKGHIRYGHGDDKNASPTKKRHGWSDREGGDGADHAKKHNGWGDANEEDDADFKSRRHGWSRYGDNDDDGKDPKKRWHDSDRYGSGHAEKRTKKSDRGDDGDEFSTERRHSKPHAHQDQRDKKSDGTVKNAAEQLREDTEAFVNDAFQWANAIVGQEAASPLLVETSFSLTKSAGTDLSSASCGSGALPKLFSVLRKFIDHPQSVNLLDDDVKAITWTPLSVCSSDDSSTEFEGGIYGTFRVACSDRLLLNVSIASSGATPTIKGQSVEDNGVYINVDVFDGTIVASDALGSIIGTLKNRHFPENADEVLRNWTATAQACAANQQLSVDGVVGGGWTQYKPSEKAADGFQTAVVGFAESFSLSFPESDTQGSDQPPSEPEQPSSSPEEPTNEPAPTTDKPTGESASSSSSGGDPADDTVAFPPGALRASVVPAQIATAVEAAAPSAASAYVQSGIRYVQHPTAHLSCGGQGLLAQLSSFYRSPSASQATRLAGHGLHASAVAPVAALALVAAACVAFAATTMRRRNGYQALDVQV